MFSTPSTEIIAEAGVNHNGSLDCAIELVDRAAEAGADFIKFQSFKASKLASRSAAKADYQKVTTDSDESQFTMLESLELPEEAHFALADRCAQKGIQFLSSAFDVDSLRFLIDQVGLQTLKLGSGELTNAPLLLEAARSGARLIVSTGMGSLSEVEEALGVIAFGLLRDDAPSGRAEFADVLLDPAAWSLLHARVTLMQCTTEYPAAVADTNLRAMDTMRSAFGVKVGYSDHTNGGAMSIAAVARGACVIEKHFTLDRSMKGPDHAASMEPEELTKLVSDIRAVEIGLGTGIKQPSAAEVKNRDVARRRIVAVREIGIGEKISADALTTKRASEGLPAIAYWDCVGRHATVTIAAEDAISRESFE